MHTRPRPIALPLFLSILTLILHGQVVAQDSRWTPEKQHRHLSLCKCHHCRVFPGP